MPTQYVLVDYENVRPDLSPLVGTPYKVKVFFGAKQQEGRIPYKLLKDMRALDSEPIEVPRSGKNALDMHIAYYIGELLALDPGAEIHVISGDQDFDPLLEFLRGKGVTCKRAKTIGELARHVSRAPAPRAAAQTPRPTPAAPKPAKAPRAAPAPKPVVDKLALIVKHLRSFNGKPATRKKLAQTIAAWFKQHGGEQSPKAVEQAIDELIRQKFVTQNGAKVTYSLG